MFEIEEAFMWFDIAKKDMEVHLLKRKSSAGLVAQNTFVNSSLVEFGGSNFKLQTSGTMVGLCNNRNLSIIIGGGDANDCDGLFADSSGTSSDEGGDEAEKFKNTFLKNKNGMLF